MLLIVTYAIIARAEVTSDEVFGRYTQRFVVQSPTLNMKDAVLQMVEEAGFSRITADTVIACESSWNPGAVGDSGKSWGLWQIHQPAHNLGSASFDPVLSTEYAIKLLRSHRSWKHWSCAKLLGYVE